MLSGTLSRDVITEADRAQDLKAGYVRLVGQPGLSPTVDWAEFLVNQVPWRLAAGGCERYWPLVSRQPSVCRDFYGAHANSRLKCKIPSAAKSFSVVGYNHASRSAKYQILIDGSQVYDSGVTDIAVIKVEIPAGASLLELVADGVGNLEFDHTYWCYPRYHSVAKDKITDAMVDGKATPLKFIVTDHQVADGQQFTHNQTMQSLPSTAPLHYSDAVPCYEFLFAHADSSVTYKVPEGMTRFSAIGYNARSNHVKFEVWANARKLYESPQAGIVPVEVKLPPGTQSLELRVNDLGNDGHDTSMWCYPRLYKK
jgi:hypothetical protein